MSAEAVPQNEGIQDSEFGDEVLPTAVAGTITIQPLYDRILVQRAPERDTLGDGTLVAADQYKEKPTEGTVLAVGEGRLLENGQIAPLKIKVGDRIAFGLFAGLKLPAEFGKDLVMLVEAEVLGLVTRG